MNKDVKILLITNRQDMVNDVCRAINLWNAKIDIAFNSQEALNYFKVNHHPVILCFYNTVEMAQDAYFGIFKNSSEAQTIQHRAVLLCDHVDIEKAVEKCIRDIFFDYVVITPRFDRARINLSIKNALFEVNNSGYAVTNREFAQLGYGVNDFNSEIGSAINHAAQVASSNNKEFSELSKDLKVNLKDFSKAIVKIKDESNGKINEDALEREVNKFSMEIIDKNIQKSSDSVNKYLQGYAHQLTSVRNRHSEMVARLSKLSSSIKKNVLIVEDNEVYGEMVKMMLDNASSYEVTWVSTIHQGMVHTVINRPDLVFLDYELPDATASEFLERVRAVPSAKNTPVIILTSHNHPDVYTTTIMLGAQDFIVKPSSRETILQKVVTWLSPKIN